MFNRKLIAFNPVLTIAVTLYNIKTKKMKKSKLIILLFLCILFTTCTKDDTSIEIVEEQTILTITKNIPLIKSTDFISTENLDIIFKIVDEENNRLQINDIFNVQITDNADDVTIELEIKEVYENQYQISSGGNILSNFISSIFNKCLFNNELDIIGENVSDTSAMLQVLCENSDYGITNAEIAKIPLTFQILQDSKLAKMDVSDLNNLLELKINKVNEYFSNSKIEFTVGNVNVFNVSHFSNYNVLDQTRADEADIPYDENSINIYVADYIGPTLECTSKRQGVAQFPDINFRTNRVFIEVWGFLNNIDPNTRLLTHELGHTFSLFHNFQNSPPGGFINCSNNNCLENDDTVCDTANGELDLDPNIVCDDNRVKNLMSYSQNSHPQCNNSEFTFEQNTRMRFTANYWYSNLIVTKKFNDFTQIDDVFAKNEPIYSIEFSDNGSHFYYADINTLYHYSLQNAFDLSNATLIEQTTIPNYSRSVQISNNGLKLFVHYRNGNGDVFREYSLVNPFNITDMNVVSTKSNWYNTRKQSQLVENSNSFVFSLCDYFSNTVELLSKLDVSNDAIGDSSSIGGVSTKPICFNSFSFTPEGYAIYGADTDNIIRKYKLSSPFDLSTINTDNEIDNFQLRNGEKIFYLSSEEEMFFTLRNENNEFIIGKYHQ